MLKHKIKILIACTLIVLVSLAAWTYRWELLRSLDGNGLYITPKSQNLGTCEPDTEIKVSFRMTNLTSEKISVIGLRSSCGCISGKKLPFPIEPHKTVDFDLYVVPPHDDSVYDQVAMFIVDEEKKMKYYPVRIIADISPRKEENGSKPESEP